MLATKAVNSLSSVFFTCCPTHCVHSIHMAHTVSPLWDLVAEETKHQRIDFHAACCAMSNKALCL